MTDTRDSFEKIAQELRERAETADMVLGRVGQYELKAYAGRIADLQAGAGDGVVSAILDLQPLGESRNDATRIWQMYVTPEAAMEAVKQAIDNAQATEGE